MDATRTRNGAIAGAVAAGVWAAQMPLDKRILGCDYDDVEILGKAITRGGGWRPVGLALHVFNGALFGAVYANVAPRVPLPTWSRGPLASLAENFGMWPLASLSDRHHPARKELPELAGSGRALAQATWRHTVFGIVLGELERRLNRDPDEAIETYEAPAFSTNGQGDLERATASTA